MEEIWKDVPGYEGRYQVSNLGRFKRVERATTWRTQNNVLVGRKDAEKIIKPEIGASGYPIVRLFKDGGKKRANLHRLIALSFLPNPGNKPCINHKDGIRTNNKVTNLEWCTYSENNLHEWRVLKKKHYASIPVRRKDTGETFESIAKGAASMGVHRRTLHAALKKGSGKCQGIQWETV